MEYININGINFREDMMENVDNVVAEAYELMSIIKFGRDKKKWSQDSTA